MFWDSSALIPFLVREETSDDTTRRLDSDASVVVWWAMPVECVSALERQRREGRLPEKDYREARARLDLVLKTSDVVEPHVALRKRAERLLGSRNLRAADSLQLAAALAACDESPDGESFVCLDRRLREAAVAEGFTVLP